MKTHDLVLFGLFAGALGCGGSSTARVNLFDAPPQGVVAVSIYVKSVDAHMAGDAAGDSAAPEDASIDSDGKWETLNVGKSIDLVQHQGESAALVLGELSLPQGKITQIRLVVDPDQANTATFADGRVCALDTSRVERKGIKVNHVFKAVAASSGDTNEVFLDFDLAQSMQAAGDCFVLRPVLKLTRVKNKGKEVDTLPSAAKGPRG